jgi:hypothetical protein
VLLSFREQRIKNALKYGDQGAYLDLDEVWHNDRPRTAGAYFFAVDGPHRILALQKVISEPNGDDWLSFQIPFVCMLGGNEDEEMDQFYIVNSKAKSVRTDLAYELLKERADRDGTVYQALVERGRRQAGGDSAAFAVHGRVDAGGEVTDEFVLADCLVVQRRRCSGICAASSQRLIWRSINGSLSLKVRALRANWCLGSLSSVTP